MPAVPFSVASASAVSSMAPSSVFDTPSCPQPLDPEWHLFEKTLMAYPTFPVLLQGEGEEEEEEAAASAGSATDMVLGDGGNLENLGLFSLLQRGVESAVLFLNTEVGFATLSFVGE